jgi:hypothetical protein
MDNFPPGARFGQESVTASSQQQPTGRHSAQPVKITKDDQSSGVDRLRVRWFYVGREG